MSRETSPVHPTEPIPESREFELIAQLGRVEGGVNALLARQKNLEALVAALDLDPPEQADVTVAMATTKNRVTFSGKSHERVADFLDHMLTLQVANNYSDLQLSGQTIIALRGEAESWYHREVDKATLKTDDKLIENQCP